MNPILLAVIIVGGIGLVAGIGLSVASIVMAVETDETVEALRAELPGANCGACGYSGCDGYAEALAKGEAKAGLCAPGGSECNNRLGEILGVSVEMEEPKVATVKCNGTCDRVDSKLRYVGVSTCKGANMMYAGNSACNFGCLGFGDCQSACRYGAISIENGKATVDPEKCTACTACVVACPKSIIEMMPRSKAFARVLCSNKDKGAVSRRLCEVACIGCGKCQKVCSYDAVAVENNLARIDPARCTACGECVSACPMNCITL